MKKLNQISVLPSALQDFQPESFPPRPPVIQFFSLPESLGKESAITHPDSACVWNSNHFLASVHFKAHGCHCFYSDPLAVGSWVIDADTVKAMSALLLIKWHSWWFEAALIVSMCQRWRDFALEASPSLVMSFQPEDFPESFCTLSDRLPDLLVLYLLRILFTPWH